MYTPPKPVVVATLYTPPLTPPLIYAINIQPQSLPNERRITYVTSTDNHNPTFATTPSTTLICQWCDGIFFCCSHVIECFSCCCTPGIVICITIMLVIICAAIIISIL